MPLWVLFVFEDVLLCVCMYTCVIVLCATYCDVAQRCVCCSLICLFCNLCIDRASNLFSRVCCANVSCQLNIV